MDSNELLMRRYKATKSVYNGAVKTRTRASEQYQAAHADFLREPTHENYRRTAELAEVYQEAHAQHVTAQEEFYAAADASARLRDRNKAIQVLAGWVRKENVARLKDICTWFRTPLQPKGLRKVRYMRRNLPKRPGWQGAGNDAIVRMIVQDVLEPLGSGQ